MADAAVRGEGLAAVGGALLVAGVTGGVAGLVVRRRSPSYPHLGRYRAQWEAAGASPRQLAILDEALARRPFLVGDSFTMADIPAGCTVHRWLGLPTARIPRPNVDKWYERIMNRPGARQVLTLPLA